VRFDDELKSTETYGLGGRCIAQGKGTNWRTRGTERLLGEDRQSANDCPEKKRDQEFLFTKEKKKENRSRIRYGSLWGE